MTHTYTYHIHFQFSGYVMNLETFFFETREIEEFIRGHPTFVASFKSFCRWVVRYDAPAPSLGKQNS